jgi:gingipain R
VLVDEAERIVVEFHFDAYKSETVRIGDEEFQRLWIPGEAVNLDAGAPDLPHVARSVIVPDDAAMAITVLSSVHEDSFAKIAPSKGNLLRTVDPSTVPYEFGVAYTRDELYPRVIATLGDPYIMRDHRGVTVRLHPVQYNPVSKVLRSYSRLTVEIAKKGRSSTNVLERRNGVRKGGRVWDGIYQAHFLNTGGEARAGSYDARAEDGSMLVICHDPWIPNMAPFVAHKSRHGISTTLVGVSTIGNNATAIHDYIRDAYHATDLAYVLLVGDIDQVASPSASGGASDPTYSKLSGDDDYPEILVGRFSANLIESVDTQVERTIAYETMPATRQDWFRRGTGIASREGAGDGDEGQSDTEHVSEIREWLIEAGYTEVDEFYAPGIYAPAVSSALNTGRGVVNYTGHGDTYSWLTTGFDNADVLALGNTGMLPFIVSVACLNGEFHNAWNCFAEAWLRATHNGEPAGAIAFYGSSISQSWAPPMEGQDEFNLLLTDPTHPYKTFGGLCFAGSASMMDAYGPAGIEIFDTWNVFGDPSLRVVGMVWPPTGLRVSPTASAVVHGPAGGPFDPAVVEFTLENFDDAPLEYEVTCDQPWVTIEHDRGTIDVGATVMVTVTINDRAANLDNGRHAASLQFKNLTDGHGDTTHGVALSVGFPVLFHEWKLDTDPLWQRENKWGFGQPLGNGGVQMGYPDPVAGATGNNVFGFVLAGDYGPGIGGPYHLTTPAIDLSQAAGVTLSFRRWLNAEAMAFAETTVEVSNDGTEWTRTWSSHDPITENAWSFQEYDAAAVADGQPSVYFRWGIEVHEDATPCSGWNIDDVEVWGASQDTARIELTVERTALSWTTIADAVTYDIVRGDLELLRDTGGDFSTATEACVEDGTGETNLPLSETPPAGSGYWYLVRGVTTDGPMTYQALYDSQVGLRDPEIEAAAAACP